VCKILTVHSKLTLKHTGYQHHTKNVTSNI
jgi:hypothetical protein